MKSPAIYVNVLHNFELPVTDLVQYLVAYKLFIYSTIYRASEPKITVILYR